MLDMDRLPRIAIVGPGKLAHSFVPALQSADIPVLQVLSRTESSAQAFAHAHHIPHAAALPGPIHAEVDLVLLTVPDAAIGPVAQQLAERGDLGPTAVIAHTSGSTPLAALAPLAPWTGVCYPLQMFTQQRVVDLREVPIFLEGNLAVMARLKPLVQRLSTRVYELNSEDRLRMHMGAVWACNFPNLLYQIAEEQLAGKTRLNFDVYGPLLYEQLRRVLELGPTATQTGPAVRGDAPTLETHMDLLADTPDWQALYRSLSRLINPDWEG